MKKKLFAIAALLIGCAMVCFAVVADLSGKWVGAFKTKSGEFPLVYTFKVDGNNLTGTLQGQQGEIAISEGKIDGNNFSFKLDYNGTPITNTGKYYVDSIGLDTQVSSGSFHTTLKRSAN